MKTWYAKIVAGVVVQKQPYPGPGFVEVPEWVACEMVADGKGGYSAPPPAPPAIPAAVEAWQAKRALVDSGHYAKVEGVIAALGDDPESLAIKVDWACAKTFRRDWPALAALAQAVDLDSEDLDALFIHASTL